MAVVIRGTNTNGFPGLEYELAADQTGGSGNSRTIKLTLSLKAQGTSTWYGFPMTWRGYVNGTWSGWMTVKGTESWMGSQGWRSYTWTYTTEVGTSASKAISVGFQTDSSGGDDTWDTLQTGNFTVWQTNVPPVLTGYVTTNVAGIIPENATSIGISCPIATDANGNLAGYRAQVSVNDGGWTEIYRGASTTYTHNISSYGQGTKFRYRMDAYDSVGAYSADWIYSGVITKNTMTADTLNSTSGTIAFNSTSTTFTYSGASNTNGNAKFTRVLSCDGVTVYNPVQGDSPITVQIYKSGTVPTGTYIKFEDIKNKFMSLNYTGNLQFTLTTTNNYGTIKTSGRAVYCDLRTAPAAPSSVTIDTNPANSTAYKKVTFSENSYFIPDVGRIIRVNWGAGSDPLGQNVTYTVQAKIGSGNFVTLSSGVTGLFYNYPLGKQNVSQSLVFRIITNSSFGYEAYRDSAAATLHFYNEPTLTKGEITRTDTTAVIPITVKSVSSIPNIGTIGSWTGKGSGNLTITQGGQNISLTGLTADASYNIVVTYNDNTGFSTNKTATIAVGANMPIMAITKYGIGVGGSKADANYSLNVNGSVNISGQITTSETGALKNKKGDVFLRNNNTGATVLSNANGSIYFRPQGDLIPTNEVVISPSGILNAPNLTVNGSAVYHTNRPPTPADIGASSTSHNHDSVYAKVSHDHDKVITSNSGGVYNGNGDASSSTVANIQIKSWFGVGFAPSIAGQTVPQNQNAIWMNVRNGDISARNEMYAQSNKRLYHDGWCGSITKGSPRVTNLNTIYNSGWYGWSGNGTGTPNSYGIVLNIVWGEAGVATADRYQMAIGANNVCYIRSFVNNAWNAWKAW